MGKARWLQVFSVGFLVGMALSQYYSVPPETVLWLSFGSIAISIALHQYHFTKTALFLLLIGGAVGILRSTIYNQTISFDPEISANFKSWRSQTIERLTAKMPEPEGHLTASIILGGAGILPTELQQPMIRTGTIHMAAVSGANLTIILQLASVILPFLFGRWFGFFIGSLTIAAFLGLTGLEPSIVRASLLGWLFLLTRVSHRVVSPIHSAMIVASVMVAFQPRLIVDIGFQLSFTSYLGLVLFQEPISQLLDLAPRLHSSVLRFLSQPFSATLAAQILSLPLIIHYFGRLSIVSIPANMVVGQIVTIMMFLGTTVLSLTYLPLIGQWLALILAPFAWAVERVVLWFDSIPYASVPIPPAASWLLVIYYGLIILFVFQRSLNRLATDPRFYQND